MAALSARPQTSTFLLLTEQLLDHSSLFFQFVDARLNLSLGEIVEGDALDDFDFLAIRSGRKRTDKTFLNSVASLEQSARLCQSPSGVALMIDLTVSMAPCAADFADETPRA